MGRRKPYYTLEFKSEAVGLARNSDKTLTEVAKNIGVSESALRQWVRQADIDDGKGPQGALTSAEREELVRLRRENRQIKMERDFLKKSQHLLRQGELVGPYETIEAEKETYPIAMMCDLLEVSRSGYYAWRQREPSKREQDDAMFVDKIKASHKESRGTYGSPRIVKDLKAEGFEVGRRRIARLMKEHGISGDPPKAFKRTTDSNHHFDVAENIVNRQFTPPAKNLLFR